MILLEFCASNPLIKNKLIKIRISQSILGTPKVLGLSIKASKHHDFSNSIIFDFSALSGSQIQEINVFNIKKFIQMSTIEYIKF